MAPQDPDARATVEEDDDIDVNVGLKFEDFEEEDEDQDFNFGVDEDPEDSSLRVVDEHKDALSTEDMPALMTGTHASIEVPDESSRHTRVAAFFQALDKYLRGIRLYEGRGDLVGKLGGRAQARADAMVADGDVLVRVAPFGVLFEGNSISPAEDKPAQYLFRLFCDGVRELTFLRGLDAEELRTFATVLASDARNAEEDIITLLWKKELKTIRYYATDTLQMDAEGTGEEDLALAGKAKSRLQAGQGEGQQLVMSADDLRMLNTDDALLWVRACRSPSSPAAGLAGTTVAIKGSFSKFGDYGRFVDMALRATQDRNEASPLVLGLFDGVLASGESEAVGGLLSAGAAVAKKSEGGRKLRDAFLTEKRIAKIAVLFDRTPSLAGPIHEAAEGRREVLVDLLNRLKSAEIRDTLRARLVAEGVDLTAYYSERLNSSDQDVLIEAVQALGKIGGSDAARAIIPALGATSTPVRRAGLEAMVGAYHPDARVALSRALRDPDNENRALALRILQESGDNRAAGALLTAVQATSFNSRDASEKEAFYEALAAFKDRRTIQFFDGILGQKNLTRSKIVAAQQMTAVRALSSMGTAEASEVLGRASKRWFLPNPVREAAQRGANKALRG
jgi:hypothetical protein